MVSATAPGSSVTPSRRRSPGPIDTVKASIPGQEHRVVAALGLPADDVVAGRKFQWPPDPDRSARIYGDDMSGAGCVNCTDIRWSDWIGLWAELRGVGQGEAARAIAEVLGVEVPAGKGASPPAGPNETGIPKTLKLRKWDASKIQQWCDTKPPITPDAVRRIGGQLARYVYNIGPRDKPEWIEPLVVAFPVLGPDGTKDKRPVNWIVSRIDGEEILYGGKRIEKDKSQKTMTIGDGSDFVDKYGKTKKNRKNFGVLADTDQLDDLIDGKALPKLAIKVEGISDLLALLSREDLPPGNMPFTNPFGCREQNKVWEKSRWFYDLFRGIDVWVIHDADRPGQEGAIGKGKSPGWCHRFAEAGAADVRNVQLPFPVEASHGPDLRDFFAGGGSWSRLIEIAEASDPVEPMAGGEDDSPDDMYRLDQELDSGRTDLANAQRFVDRYHAELLSVPRWGRWLAWDGHRWADDDGVGARQRARRYVESLWHEIPKIAPRLDDKEIAKVCGYIKSSSQAAKIEAFMRLAASDERVVCKVDELNGDPLLLNVANGTIDLSTGELQPHNPADRITQLAPVNYDPEATCPKWMETLNIVFDGNAALISYVQRLLGYSISGDTGEHILPICYGNGHNGKSTIWNTILELMGDYAALGNESLLLGEKHSHPTEIAFLYQKRFVPISEPERGAKLRESRVKELTGERTVTARRMKEDFWSFIRTHTFWLSTNHLPRITGRDEGMWRRVKLIPFTVDVREKVDAPIKDFDRWLVRNEGPGILAWLVRGFLDYRREGLTEPEAVTERTKSFREDSDPLKDFLEEYCDVGEGEKFKASAAELFAAYSNEEKFGGKWTKTAFGRAMGERFKKTKCNEQGPYKNKHVYLGVSLKPEPTQDEKSDDEGNSGKSEENDKDAKLRQVSPLPEKIPIRAGETSGKTWRNLAPSDKCPECGGRLIPAEEICGWQNLDCESCDFVVPVEVAR